MKKLLVLVPFLLAGCIESEPANDVKYYMDNEADRIAKIEECENDAALMLKGSSCANAIKAADKIAFNPSNTGMPSIKKGS